MPIAPTRPRHMMVTKRRPTVAVVWSTMPRLAWFVEELRYCDFETGGRLCASVFAVTSPRWQKSAGDGGRVGVKQWARLPVAGGAACDDGTGRPDQGWPATSTGIPVNNVQPGQWTT